MYSSVDFHNRCTHWESLEISYDEDVVFLGGSDSTLENGSGYLLALTFNDANDLIRDRQFPGSKAISALRRHNEGNILFAGSYRTIYVMFWANKQFHLLNQVNVPIDRLPRDIAHKSIDNELYAVFETDKAVAIYFDENT